VEKKNPYIPAILSIALLHPGLKIYHEPPSSQSVMKKMKPNYVFVNTKPGKVAEVYAKLQEREDVSVAAITMGRARHCREA